MKKHFAEFLSKLGTFAGWMIVGPVGLLIGAFGLLHVVLAVLVPAWLLWEFWPFQNDLSQRLSYTEIVETNSAVMKKINVLEFELSVDRQRVIQKIVAPVQGDRGRPNLCGLFGITCGNNDGSDDAERRGFREIWTHLPSEAVLLSELKNCTIKSSDDWICKSAWYGSPKDADVSYVGKSEGEWISNPPLSKYHNWKILLILDRARCGGNVCFVMSIEEQKRRFKELENMIRGGVVRDEK